MRKLTPALFCLTCACLPLLQLSPALAAGGEQRLKVPGKEKIRQPLKAGETIEISARIVQPSRLPPNGRLRVHWRRVDEGGAETSAVTAKTAATDKRPQRKPDFDGIYTQPTSDWSKLLHALDSDVFLVYRAPAAGTYELTVQKEEGPVDLFQQPRWREKGKAPNAFPNPRVVKWPAKAHVEVAVAIQTLDVRDAAEQQTHLEAEPNDTPEQAQLIPLSADDAEFTLHVLGGADDVEYFDNGRVGSSGDDWFRLEFKGSERRLLTACLSIPDQQVAARIRAYRVSGKNVQAGFAQPVAGVLLPIQKYEDGKNPNERAHQQTEQHRIAINRWLDPQGVYFLRVEANAPGYDLELRIVRPAPFDDPRRAVRHGLYDHLGQVDSWLTNRPRGASVERRIRDSGNLLGTNCMSCHTQSGVWGPAIPFAHGYRPQNVQLWRHLVNTCYQSLRPTNKLKDAANNTSLRPFDLGDGPAGTRVAGHAVVSLERYAGARRLQSSQARRCANFVLQSGDPGGINAAGPGANVGKGVVFNYAGEIVWTAWRETGEERYFRSLEDKARRMLAIQPKYCDDLGHRVEFFRRYFPEKKAYLTAVARYAKADQREQAATKAAEFADQIEKQVQADLARLRAIQHTDGSWSFDPGARQKDGSWKVADRKADPSPSALAIIALQAAGCGLDDPTISKGVQALLRMQHPTGYWNGKSQTGFVSTSYAVHALARLYPAEPPRYEGPEYQTPPKETLLQAVARARRISVAGDPRFVPQMIQDGQHARPLVRYWACIGLGATHSPEGVPTLVANLGHPAKMVREAAHWGLRQTLIDDTGWRAVFKAARSGDDRTREAAMRALIMKVDTVLPKSRLSVEQLTGTLDRSLNEDPHPAVRAWATRAGWQWWVWNPPVRKALNRAWVKLLTRPEPNAVTENAIRYQSHALFVANGHIANATKEHQYKELAELFSQLHKRLGETAKKDRPVHERLTSRLTAVASTFYGQRGGDGGPGQLGYSTPGSGSLFGDAILSQLQRAEKQKDRPRYETLAQLTLEGAANIPHEGLQEQLVAFSLNGLEKLRSVAASSISDPRLVSLVAVPEKLEPMYAQLLRGAREPERRQNLSEPILKMYRGVRWIVPDNREQRVEILQFVIPDVSAYRDAKTLQAIADKALRDAATGASDAAWYLADGLGRGVAENPDLHFDAVVEAFPARAKNAAQQRFWLRSVPWILTYQRELPEVRSGNRKLPPIDPYELIRTRAVALFVSALSEAADPRNRQIAVDLANKTAMRRNPEVLSALERLVKFEKRKPVLDNAKKVLSQNRGNFLKELTAAAHQEKQPQFRGPLPEDFVSDVVYFRDYVIPEMSKVLRGDERSCMICHGEPGRVPSMELHKPDDVGFLPIKKLLANYRILQDRIDLKDVARSKLLRKPLNVQSGKEDGHQGGRRYQPTDEGYLILRRWVMSQTRIQAKYGRPPAQAVRKE